MRVLHVIPAVAPRYGGPSRAVVEMCRALRDDGVETLIAATDADGEGRLAVELGRTISFGDVPAIFFPRQWSEAYKYSKPLSRWLDEHVADFDVVHIHAVFSHACIAAARACGSQGVPYVVRPLGTLDPWSLRQKPVRKKLFWHLGVGRMLRKAAAIHYTAPAEQRLAEEKGRLARGVVIPLGVETDQEEQAARDGREEGDFLPKGQPYILVLSRLHRKKGIELLLPAFLSAVRRGFGEWKLVLAGDGDADYLESLRRLVESERGAGHVVFTGWLDGQKKKSVLRGAALLALTSYQENFGLCVVEALACGVPALVSPHVNLAPEIEAAGAGWVAPLDAGSLESALLEAMGDVEERARRGRAGVELARRDFSWDAVVKQLTFAYNEVM